MILRALFWISVVAILMPREPDLGLGRPNFAGGANLGSHATCSERGTCRQALGLLDQFQSMAVRNLAEIKADIEREQRRHTDDSAD
jgi:hypothetical protein